jgi:hypothetical protein
MAAQFFFDPTISDAVGAGYNDDDGYLPVALPYSQWLRGGIQIERPAATVRLPPARLRDSGIGGGRAVPF